MSFPLMDMKHIILGPLIANTTSSFLDSEDHDWVLLLMSCIFFIEVFVPSDLAYKALTRKLRSSAQFWIDKW